MLPAAPLKGLLSVLCTVWAKNCGGKLLRCLDFAGSRLLRLSVALVQTDHAILYKLHVQVCGWGIVLPAFGCK